MPIEFAAEETAGYFVTKWTGRITDESMIPAYEGFFGSEDWSPNLKELGDLSEADMSHVTADGLRKLAEYSEEFYRARGLGNVACAVFAPNDLPFGLARMYSAMAEASPESVRVFRRRDEAERWLTDHSASA